MKLLQFGPFQYDSETGTLSKGGTEQVLRHQVNALLRTFLENEGSLLSREQLIAAIWPQDHVEPNTFFQCMNHLRKALGESSDEPRFIKNYPRKGYVWICPIQTVPIEANQFKRPHWPLPLLAVTLATAFFWIGAHLRETAPKGETTLLWDGPSANFKLRDLNPVGEAIPAMHTNQASALASPRQEKQMNLYLGKTMAEMRGDYPSAFAQSKAAFDQGNPLKCERILTQILTRATQENYAEAKAMALLALGRITRFRNPTLALKYLDEAKSLYLHLRNQQKFHESTYVLVLVHLDLGEWDTVRHLLQVDLFPRGRRKRQQGAHFALANGLLHLKTGDLAGAESILDEGRYQRSIRHRTWISLHFDLLEAALLLAKGQYFQAQQVSKSTLSRASREGQPFIAVQAQWLLGQAELLGQNFDQAKQHFTQAHQAAQAHQMDFFLAKTHWMRQHLPEHHREIIAVAGTPSSENLALIERFMVIPTDDASISSAQLFNL